MASSLPFAVLATCGLLCATVLSGQEASGPYLLENVDPIYPEKVVRISDTSFVLLSGARPDSAERYTLVSAHTVAGEELWRVRLQEFYPQDILPMESGWKVLGGLKDVKGVAVANITRDGDLIKVGALRDHQGYGGRAFAALDSGDYVIAATDGTFSRFNAKDRLVWRRTHPLELSATSNYECLGRVGENIIFGIRQIPAETTIPSYTCLVMIDLEGYMVGKITTASAQHQSILGITPLSATEFLVYGFQYPERSPSSGISSWVNHYDIDGTLLDTLITGPSLRVRNIIRRRNGQLWMLTGAESLTNPISHYFEITHDEVEGPALREMNIAESRHPLQIAEIDSTTMVVLRMWWGPNPADTSGLSIANAVWTVLHGETWPSGVGDIRYPERMDLR